MRRSLYASGGLHFALLLWVILGGSWFRDSEEPEFEVTGVTLVSVQDFEAMFEAPVPGTKAGDIIQVMAEGFMLHDRLLRPAQVGVSSTPK